MLAIDNHLGKITISEESISAVAEHTVTSCFGVTGINYCGIKNGIKCFLKHGTISRKGVSIRIKNNELIINLHITVTFGTNISAIADSIRNKVRFAVEEAIGFQVSEVNVFIDDMKSSF